MGQEFSLGGGGEEGLFVRWKGKEGLADLSVGR